MSGLYCIILAGGSGSRLWPVSRELFPKQTFKIDSDYSLFQKTFLNLADFIDDKNIITAASIKHTSEMKRQLKVLQEKFCRKSEYKVISEPISRNTAPAISIAVKYIKDKLNFSDDKSVILVVPSDQLIQNRAQFSYSVQKGVNLAKEGYIVSFGIETKKIDENFGYIKAIKNKKISETEPAALKVSQFIEKPATKEQKDKLKGRFFVNTGIYMFTAKAFFTELKKHAPNIYKITADKDIKNTIPSVSLNDYEKMPDISIDYALMEKCRQLVILPFGAEWKDIGSWSAVYDISPKDNNGNCFIGKTIDLGSKNLMVYSTSRLTATIGLSDMIVAETQDALMVCDKNNISGVKNLYKKLNGKNAEKKHIHKTVYRPWGCYTQLESGDGFLTKCITVNPNAKLSVQMHNHRSEHWIILEGEAKVLKGEKTITLHSGESTDIDIKEVHSLENIGKEQLKVLEVQQGEILDENDIVRLKDIYGRV